MEVARSLRHDSIALQGLISLLARQVQSRALMNWVGCRFDCEPDDLLFPLDTPISPDGRTWHDLVTEVEPDATLSLSFDSLLPWPWSPERLGQALSELSPNGSWGTWKQDLNHQVILWLPWQIGWVLGGNHSIAAGMAYGCGVIKPEACWDISQIYEFVKTDGLHYFRIHDGRIISPVVDLEMAAIFKIGRLL